ncbi:MAG: hypothetical protein JEZ12_26650 [Desulfobacterium sp.]|nr:hypothetical protein [Desulfobacterium sp.]
MTQKQQTDSTDTKSQTNIDVLQSVLEEETVAAREAETKTCPCGKTFTRPEGISSKSWGRMKYCDKHRAMQPHVRQKDIERILAGKGKAGNASTITPAASPAPDPDPVPDPAQEGITWKRCAYKECGEIFYRREGMPEGAWSTKKFHCEACRRKFGYARDREKKREQAEKQSAGLVGYSPEKAQAVADEKWEDLAQVLSVFVDDVKTLDTLKATCTKIGADCYKQCAQDMGVEV